MTAITIKNSIKILIQRVSLCLKYKCWDQFQMVSDEDKYMNFSLVLLLNMILAEIYLYYSIFTWYNLFCL